MSDVLSEKNMHIFGGLEKILPIIIAEQIQSSRNEEKHVSFYTCKSI